MNLTGVINMAHGSFLDPRRLLRLRDGHGRRALLVALIAAPILVAIVGIAVERGLVRPLPYGRDPLGYSLFP